MSRAYQRKTGNDLIEEKASKVVVPLMRKSSEHNEEQEHLRAERCQNAISSGPAAMMVEHTCAQGTLPTCGGLSKLRHDEREGGRESILAYHDDTCEKRENLRGASSVDTVRWILVQRTKNPIFINHAAMDTAMTYLLRCHTAHLIPRKLAKRITPLPEGTQRAHILRIIMRVPRVNAI